jgi:hypothetical protein
MFIVRSGRIEVVEHANAHPTVVGADELLGYVAERSSCRPITCRSFLSPLSVVWRAPRPLEGDALLVAGLAQEALAAAGHR